jgi:putative membrane protein
MNLHRTLHCVSISLLALLPSALLTTYAQTSSGTPASHADKQFVVAAIRGCMAEVELGKLAAEKGTGEDIKQFAQKMVTDHTQLGEQMKRVAHQIGVPPPSTLSPSDRALEARLKTLSADAFDRAYIQAIVKVHEDDLGEFNREIADASSFFVKDAAREGAKVIQEHLDIIRNIARNNNVASN